MWTAIVYVWPKTPILQLRACLCVLLLAIMRLLNLAVPILYRNMVNILSDAAIAASSGSPTGWQPTFWNVRHPPLDTARLALAPPKLSRLLKPRHRHHATAKLPRNFGI